MRCPGFVIWVALAVGCADREIEDLERAKQTVCSCRDKLEQDLAKLTPGDSDGALRATATQCADAALKQVPQTESKSSHRAQRIAREMLDCVAKIYEQREAPEPDEPVKPIIAPGTSAPASARTP
jgi:hypothetical protein